MDIWLLRAKQIWFNPHRRFEMAAKKKTIKRRAWTPEDVKEFKSLAKAKTPAAKIARRFKRTEGAIRQKALHLGISLNSRGR
ncbi:MAG TPA: hypothetical protein VMF67_02215 [Rhizomicrobium sp.]|nr:hypothetical protein [Rhizomicrobium sp.]